MESLIFCITFYDIAFLGAVFISLTLSLFLWIAPKQNQTANRWLAFLMAVIALCTIKLLATDIGFAGHNPIWNHLPLRFAMIFGPLIYFYTRQIVQPKRSFHRKDLLHFIPILPELSIQAFPELQNLNTSHPGYFISNYLLPLSIFLSVGIYLYLSHLQIINFYQAKQFQGGDRQRNDLLWLDRLLTILGVL